MCHNDSTELDLHVGLIEDYDLLSMQERSQSHGLFQVTGRYDPAIASMFLRDRRPRSAIHLFCNAAAGCSVAGLALLAEERRRRIALAQRIVENGRRLQAYKAYHGNAAIAVFENDMTWHLEPCSTPDQGADPQHVHPIESPTDALTFAEWRNRGRTKSSLPRSTQIYSHRDPPQTHGHPLEPFPLERWRTRMHTHDHRPASVPLRNGVSLITSTAPSAIIRTTSPDRQSCNSGFAGQRTFSDERVKRARAVHRIQLALKDGIKARLTRADCEEDRLKAYAELYFYFTLHNELVSAPLRSFIDHIRGHKGNQLVKERNGKTWQTLPHDMRAAIEEACIASQNSRSKASLAGKVAMDVQNRPVSLRQSTLVQYLSHFIKIQRPDEAYLALHMACSSLIGPIEPALRSCVRLIIDAYKTIGCSTLVLELHKALSLIVDDVFLSHDLSFLLGQESGPMRLHICQTILKGSFPDMPRRPGMPMLLRTCLQWLLDNDGCDAAAYVFTRLSTGRIPVTHRLLEKILPDVGNLIRQRAQEEARTDLFDSVGRVLETHGIRTLRHAERVYSATIMTGSPRQMQRALSVLCQIISAANIKKLLSTSVQLQQHINNTHALLLKRIWTLTNNYKLLEQMFSQMEPYFVSTLVPEGIQDAMAAAYADELSRQRGTQELPLRIYSVMSICPVTSSSHLILKKAQHHDWAGVEADLREIQLLGVSKSEQLRRFGVFGKLIKESCNQNQAQRTIDFATTLFRGFSIQPTPEMCRNITHSLVNEEQIGPCAQWLDFCASSNMDLYLADATLRLMGDRLGLNNLDRSTLHCQDRDNSELGWVLRFPGQRSGRLHNRTVPQVLSTDVSPEGTRFTSITSMADLVSRLGTFVVGRRCHNEAERIVSRESSSANSTMRAMRRELAFGEPAKAFSIYKKSLIDDFPLRPHLLATAAEISTRLHGTLHDEAVAMVQSAEAQGLCTDRARRAVSLRGLETGPITEDTAKGIIFDDYKSTERLGLPLDHIVFYAVLQRLADQNEPVAVLRVCQQVHSSSWAKRRPFNHWLVAKLMSLFISMDSQAGICWVHETVCQSMRPSRQYLVTLQQARGKTDPKMMAEICEETRVKREAQKAQSRVFLELFAALLRR